SIESALGVRAAVDFVIEGGEDGLKDVVRIIIVVAVFGGFVPQTQAQALGVMEVVTQSAEQFVHGNGLAVEDVKLDGGKRVGAGTGGNAHDVSGVVAGAPVIVVHALCDTVLDEKGEEGSGHIVRVEALNHVVAADLDVDEMVELFAESGEHLVVGSELAGISGLGADFLAGARVHTVVQGDLQNFREIEITGEDVGFFAKSARFNAARDAAAAGVFEGLPLAEQFFDNHVGVENGRLAPAFAHNFQSPFEEAIGVLHA